MYKMHKKYREEALYSSDSLERSIYKLWDCDKKKIIGYKLVYRGGKSSERKSNLVYLDEDFNFIGKCSGWKDKDGINHVEYYGKFGELLEQEEVSYTKLKDGGTRISTKYYDAEGKFLYSNVAISSSDKHVIMEDGRKGLFSWADDDDALLSAFMKKYKKESIENSSKTTKNKKGKVTMRVVSQPRESVNSTLQAILKDNSLSSNEKRQQRKALAQEYRLSKFMMRLRNID